MKNILNGLSGKEPGKAAERLVEEYLKCKYPDCIVQRARQGKKGSGVDLRVVGREEIDVKWQGSKRYISIYSRTFSRHAKSAHFFKRYRIYVVYEAKNPKLKIIMPSKIFAGINKKKFKALVKMKGKYWWNVDIVLSPTILNGIEPIDLKRFFNEKVAK